MRQKYVYLLEHIKRKRPIIVGVYSSRKKAESALKGLPKSYPFILYKLRLNTTLTKGKTLEDQQGVYDHWHYGTDEITTVMVDDGGNVINRKHGKKYVWRYE